jgi:DNA-binding protein WhiA
MSFSSKVKNEIRNKHFTTINRHSKISGNSNLDCDAELLAALFLKCGTVSDPEKSYHLEFLCDSDEEADTAAGALARLGISAGITRRKGRIAVYIKGREGISDLLAALGAYNALLEFENALVLKEMRGGIQRRVNCETANISKTVSASMKQVEDIRYIESTAGLSFLPETLRQAARLRMDFPEATLSELADRLPGTGRSGINHRLRKISKIADDMRAGKTG